jgi:p-hydroxybenzoate 3-monooxygenase
MRTQVGIVGAGPAGLLLSHLLALRGIDSLVVEDRSRAYCEARQRAGLLEDGTVRLLREADIAQRLDAEGLEHGGIYLQFAGERHHLDFRDLTGGRTVTIYAQTEVVKDLIARRLADGGALEFEISDTAVADLDTDRPVLSYATPGGERREVICDAIAGCDGFHGICRPSIPAGLLTIRDRDYPYAWLGITAEVPPSTDELIYNHHPEGFALHTMRTPQISRLYLQVPPDERIEAWPDERIWAALQRRLFLAGDAAHIVPPTGAKGLNLAVADVTVLADALEALLRGDSRPADGYSDACLSRVWRATHFSWWMTTMLHVARGADPMTEELQLAQLRYVTTSRAAATSLAENYTGYPPLR